MQRVVLQQVSSEASRWAAPYLQAACLKSVWVVTLPIWLAMTKMNEHFQTEITFRRPLKPTMRVLALCLGLTVLVQASSATWIASLGLTAVSVNSAIYNINPLLVYAFSVVLLGEPPSLPRTGAVLLAMVGTSVVTLGTAHSKYVAISDGDATEREGAIFGNVLVVISATLFALKEVGFKRYFPSVTISLTPFTDALLVVGLIGLVSALTLPLLAFFLHATGIEPFSAPPVDLAYNYAIVAGLMASYQACLLAAIALTSPTFVAMGTMLAVPASIGLDFVLKGYIAPPVALLGVLGIVAAFLVLCVSERIDEMLVAARRKALQQCEPARAAGGKPTSAKTLI